MEYLYGILGWGFPIGIALFFFLSGAGLGIFFWGLSKLKQSDRDNTKI